MYLDWEDEVEKIVYTSTVSTENILLDIYLKGCIRPLTTVWGNEGTLEHNLKRVREDYELFKAGSSDDWAPITDEACVDVDTFEDFVLEVEILG